MSLKEGAARKLPRPEICQLFRRFHDAEAKVVKYVVDNQVACGIPARAVAAMRRGVIAYSALTD